MEKNKPDFIFQSVFWEKLVKDYDRISCLIITLVFIATRFFIHGVGVNFRGQYIKRMWHSIDIVLLQTKLFESVFYSHAQPPLFNLFNGFILKLFPSHYPEVFHLLFLFIGWLACILIYRSLRLFNVSAWLSLTAGLYFMLSPVVILYENLYSYTYINVFLITLVIYLLLRFINNRKSIDWVLLWCSLSSIALIRSSYHLLWLFAIAFIFILLYDRKLILSKNYFVGMVIPISIVFGWYLKNQIVFGTFSSSTWLGMNMARIMPPKTLLGEIGPFKSAETYSMIEKNQAYPNVALLHNECKTNSGYINYFHIDYISIADQFKKEVFSEIKQNPLKYMEAVKNAGVLYFNPSTHSPFIDDNYSRIIPYASILNLDFSGYNRYQPNHFSLREAYPVLFLYILLMGMLVYCFYRNRFSNEEKIVVITLLFFLFYSLVVSSLFEFGENNRFRFETITVFLVLFTKTASTFWFSLKRR